MGYLPQVQVWVDPQVHSQQPMAVPVPLGQVWVINGYGSWYGKNTQGLPMPITTQRHAKQREDIAKAMWLSYQKEMQERGKF